MKWSHLLFALPVLLNTATAAATKGRAESTPNVVIIFIDDMGYADIGPTGNKDYPTPNIDRMAVEGRLFTDFQVAQSVCSASRAALMTGCYSNRVSITGALGPKSQHGISDDEVTIAEICKQRGYATAAFGKWHLGDLPRFLPVHHGFDEYFGLPYSNDMWPYGYDNKPAEPGSRKSRHPPLPLIEGDRIVDPNVTPEKQEMLTTWYTDHAVDFINRNKDHPFFLYVPHSMVHVPLFVSDRFKGKSGHGLFGDVMMEVDWSVGRILDALRANNISENTLVIFTADNGPWLNYGEHAGKTGGLREGKSTEFEGGSRNATIMWWPGVIPAGTTCDTVAMTIDILPTVARLVGATLPDHKIDGLDIWPLIAGKPGAKNPHDAYFLYWNDQLQAVRTDRWKLHLPHRYRHYLMDQVGHNGFPGKATQEEIGLTLYDMKADRNETTDVKDKHPDVVAQLEKLADVMRADLGDEGHPGPGIRPPGRVAPEDAHPGHGGGESD